MPQASHPTPGIPVFFADGTRAGILKDITDDSLTVVTEQGAVVNLLRLALDRTEGEAATLVCAEYNISAFTAR